MAGVSGCDVPLFKRLLLVAVVVFVGVPHCQSANEKLVGLSDTAASQNSRYVEIRRAPSKSRMATDVSESDVPSAHAIRQLNDVRRAPKSEHEQQSNPSNVNNNNNNNNIYNQYPYGYGLSPPLTPMMQPYQMPYIHPYHHHQMPLLMPYAPYHQLNHPLLQNSQNILPSTQVQQHPLVSPPTPLAIESEPATLSATQNPLFSLPTLPTLPMPTFPPFTLPPSFDQMAAGYTKKKKKSRKNRRKAPKTTESNEKTSRRNSMEASNKNEKQDESDSAMDNSVTKDIVTKKQTKLFKEQKDANADWMVPYYNNDRKKQ